VNPFIEKLLKIQELDKRLMEATHRLHEIPKEINAIEQNARDLEAKVAQERKNLQDLEVKRRDLDQVLKSTEDLIVKHKSQQLQVKKTEEFEALNNEIEKAQATIGDQEDEEMALLLKIDEENEALQLHEVELREMSSELKSQIETLRDQEKSLKESLTELENNLSQAEGEIDAPTLSLYKRVRQTRKKPPFIVPLDLEERRCQGCYLKVSNDIYSSMVKGAQLQQCDQCTRILFLKDTEE